MKHQPGATATTPRPVRFAAPGPYNATAALRQARTRSAIAWTVGLLVLAGLVTLAMLSARPQITEDSGLAPDFSLTNTDGNTVSLADFRGTPVVLYFNEGAGCESCIYQMRAIEDNAGFAENGIVVLPIVMDDPDFIRAAMGAMGISTPFLIDDGRVSAEYGTLGTGMHAGLPGHGFVLINADGDRVWQGEYPSMWLPPGDLLSIVLGRL